MTQYDFDEGCLCCDFCFSHLESNLYNPEAACVCDCRACTGEESAMRKLQQLGREELGSLRTLESLGSSQSSGSTFYGEPVLEQTIDSILRGVPRVFTGEIAVERVVQRLYRENLRWSGIGP